MSFFSALGHAFKASTGLVGVAAEGLGQLIGGAEHWLDHVFDGIPGAQAMSIAEIVQQIQSGYGSGDLHDGAQVANAQIGEQNKISDGSHDLVMRLESAWSGQGADAARENIRPLALSADDASRTLQANAQHIQTQADTFDRIKNSVQPMADPKPEKGWLDDFSPVTTDAERAVNQYNQQAQANQQIYDQYHQSSTTVAQGIKVDYGTLPDAQNAQIGNFQLNTTQPETGKTVDHNGPGQIGSTGGGGPSRYQAPAGASNYSLPAASVRPSVTSSPPSYSRPSTSPYNNSTTTSGYVPPGGSNSNNQPGSFGPTGSGGYDPSSAAAAAGFGPMGGGGGFGPTGGGAVGGSSYGGGGAAGAGAGGSLQAGNRVGAGGSGGYAAGPGAASAAGAAGGAGSAGRSGMSGMGGGGHGKGEGAEDEEHETKYLVAEDGDEIFGTDQKTAPPVIGL